MPTLSPERDRTKRYEKIDFLGEGQFATVYKAKDTQDDNKIVAGGGERKDVRTFWIISYFRESDYKLT